MLKTHCRKGHLFDENNTILNSRKLRSCRTCYQNYQADYRKNGSHKNRMKDYQGHYRRKRKYGMSPEAYKAMLIDQDFKCDICRKPFGESKAPSVDHDHNSGEIRALLCNNCNVLIALANEDPNRLNQAIFYLEKFRKSNQMN